MNKGPVKVHEIHEGAPWDFMKLMNSIWNGRIHQKRLHEIHEYSFHWKSKKLAAEIPRLAAEISGLSAEMPGGWFLRSKMFGRSLPSRAFSSSTLMDGETLKESSFDDWSESGLLVELAALEDWLWHAAVWISCCFWYIAIPFLKDNCQIAMPLALSGNKESQTGIIGCSGCNPLSWIAPDAWCHLLRWSFSASQTTSTFLASEIYYAKHACWKDCVSLWLGWKCPDSVAVLNSSLLRWFDSGRGLVESIWSTSVKVDTISFGKWAGPYAGNPRIFELVGSIMCPPLHELSEALWNCICPSCCFLHGKGILPVWHGPKTACIHAL